MLDNLDEAVKEALKNIKRAEKSKQALVYKCKLCGEEFKVIPPMERPSGFIYHLFNTHTYEVIMNFADQTLVNRQNR